VVGAGCLPEPTTIIPCRSLAAGAQGVRAGPVPPGTEGAEIDFRWSDLRSFTYSTDPVGAAL